MSSNALACFTRGLANHLSQATKACLRLSVHACLWITCLTNAGSKGLMTWKAKSNYWAHFLLPELRHSALTEPLSAALARSSCSKNINGCFLIRTWICWAE